MDFICRDICFPLRKRSYVMGILNITPDSFSDGGRYVNFKDAVERALKMAAQGADCIDIGAQSTRPGHAPVSAEEEIRRMREALPEICRRSGLPVSVDTFYPEVAVFALENGAHIINDVSGEVNPRMAEVAARFGAGWILMHADRTGGKNSPDAVRAWLANAARRAVRLGVNPSQVCLDPGIGFYKNTHENLLLIKETAAVKVPEYAYLVGASRKRFVGACCGDPPAEQRDAGSIAAHTAAILGGADFIRTHDVEGGVQAARVADAIAAG